MKNRTICFVAGKSGGHIIPCLTLAQRAKENNPDTRVLFFSTTASLDSRIMSASVYVDTHVKLPLETVTLRHWYSPPVLCWVLMRSFIMSFYYLMIHRPSLVVSTGGVCAIPVCVAAWLLRIPVELYELNVEPGKAIALLAPLASIVHVCFKETVALLKTAACVATPYPIRFNLADTLAHGDVATLDLDPTKKTILVMGGSQGSQFLNEAVERMIRIDASLARSINVIHQTGSTNVDYWRQVYGQLGIKARVFAYTDDPLLYYQMADVIISRAGAGALFEILFFKKPALIVPLETSRNTHQVDNARAIMTEYPDLFTVVRQEQVSRDVLSMVCAMHQLLKRVSISHQERSARTAAPCID